MERFGDVLWKFLRECFYDVLLFGNRSVFLIKVCFTEGPGGSVKVRVTAIRLGYPAVFTNVPLPVRVAAIADTNPFKQRVVRADGQLRSSFFVKPTEEFRFGFLWIFFDLFNLFFRRSCLVGMLADLAEEGGGFEPSATGLQGNEFRFS